MKRIGWSKVKKVSIFQLFPLEIVVEGVIYTQIQLFDTFTVDATAKIESMILRQCMTKTVMYCFKDGRLEAINGVTGSSIKRMVTEVKIQRDLGRTVITSTCGREICKNHECRLDMGPREELEAGILAHSFCDGCGKP